MIKVTRLDGTEYFLNHNHIECIEVRPDTTLMMMSGKTHIVREEVDVVLEKIMEYNRQLCPPVI
jgi:flagellar protein FlbD